MSGQPNQETLEDVENRPQQSEQAPETEVTERPVNTRSITVLSSTRDAENCGAYFTRKMELLVEEDPVPAKHEEQFSERDQHQ